MMDNNPHIYKPSSVPDEINQEKLQADVAKLGNVGVSMMSGGLVFSVYDKAIEDSAIQAIVDVHDASVKTTGQVRSDVTEVLFNQLNKRLLEEMAKSDPDFILLHKDISEMVADNVPVMNTLNNIRELHAEAFDLGKIEREKFNKLELITFVQVLSLWNTI